MRAKRRLDVGKEITSSLPMLEKEREFKLLHRDRHDDETLGTRSNSLGSFE